MQTIKKAISGIRDARWFLIYATVIIVLFFWSLIFLNKPAFYAVNEAYIRTVMIAAFAAIIAAIIGVAVALLFHYTNTRFPRIYYSLLFFMDLFRSIPQIVALLFCFLFISAIGQSGALFAMPLFYSIFMSLSLGLFIFPEIALLINERITFFRKNDFYDSLLVCGVSEKRIILFDIIFKNSMAHIVNKIIATFGMAIFLLCSVDFIISVGLASKETPYSLPLTLGTLLAKPDSKLDILAIGSLFSNPSYIINLPFVHLQGLLVAFLISFTLLCVYKIGGGLVERNKL